MTRYEIYWDPVWNTVRTKDERITDNHGNRYVLVAKQDGYEIMLAVPSFPSGYYIQEEIEAVRALSRVAYRVDSATEAALLGSWGLVDEEA